MDTPLQQPDAPRRPRVYIKSFGCQMNDYDAVRIRALLRASGYDGTATGYHDADVVVVNTCTVRQKAEDKAYSELGRIAKCKRRRPDMRICVGGCLAQQEGTRLTRRFPCIDVVFGTRSMQRLPRMLEQANTHGPVVDTGEADGSDVYPAGLYAPGADTVSAFVSIMQGCNNFCSYCIVPYVRGREWSREPQAIIDEVTGLVRAGIREVTLLGQNVNSYGTPRAHPLSFASLLAQVAAIEGLARVRFTTSHPKDLSDELIRVIAATPEVCTHIHLPVQSGSNAVLQRMNRGYTREHYLARIARLRQMCPQIAVTSDIIVGFPGETEADFAQTRRLVEEMRFDDLFIFHYTDRQGTAASQLDGKLPYPVRLRRLESLNALQCSISEQINQSLLGSIQNILVERISSRSAADITGRTETNKTVNCPGTAESIGQIVPVRIVRAGVHSLRAEPVS